MIFPVIWTLIVIIGYLLFRLWMRWDDTPSQGGWFTGIEIMIEFAFIAMSFPIALALWLGGLLIWSLWFR